MSAYSTPPLVTPDLTLLIYTSSATRDMTQNDLEQILAKSRTNNLRRNVTGILLHKGGNFLQVLEGAESSVKKVFSIVEQDTRHKDVVMILKRPVRRREFAQWAMGFACMDTTDIRQIRGYSNYLSEVLTAAPYGREGSVAYEFMETFKQGMR